MARQVALLGTGLMGTPMARNLLGAGYGVRVWNRTPDKATALAEHGAEISQTAGDAVRDVAVVITMLSDGAVTAALIADPSVQNALAAGTVWIEMSSVNPAEARAQAAALTELGVSHVDAPVSGGTAGAEAGTLAIMAGGDAETVRSVEDVLSAMGRPVHVGPSGSGQLAKLANQAIVGVTVGAVAEAMLFIERGGGDPAAVRKALEGGFADSTILQEHGARMTDRNFTPGGPAKFQIKDLGNVLSIAADEGLTLPLVEAMRARYIRLTEDLGKGDDDIAALYLELLDRNGLTL